MKKIIFLDIDGVLNNVSEDNLWYSEYIAAEKAYADAEERFDSGDISDDEFYKIESSFSNIRRKFLDDPSMKSLSEKSVRRLKEICDMTGAVVVLNGTQSAPLYNGAYQYWDVYPGYATLQGERIMDLLKKYEVPVEGYSYDRNRHLEQMLTGRVNKLIPALKYMLDNSIDQFVIVEDLDIIPVDERSLELLKKDAIKAIVKYDHCLGLEYSSAERIINNLNPEFMVDTRKINGHGTGLGDAVKEEIISKLMA